MKKILILGFIFLFFSGCSLKDNHKLENLENNDGNIEFKKAITSFETKVYKEINDAEKQINDISKNKNISKVFNKFESNFQETIDFINEKESRQNNKIARILFSRFFDSQTKILKYEISKIILIEKNKNKKLLDKTETMKTNTGDSGKSSNFSAGGSQHSILVPDTGETQTDKLVGNDTEIQNDDVGVSDETMKEIDEELNKTNKGLVDLLEDMTDEQTESGDVLTNDDFNGGDNLDNPNDVLSYNDDDDDLLDPPDEVDAPTDNLIEPDVEMPTDELKYNDDTEISEETMKKVDEELDEIDDLLIQIEAKDNQDVDQAYIDFMLEQYQNAIIKRRLSEYSSDVLLIESVDRILANMNNKTQKHIDSIFLDTNNSRKHRKKTHKFNCNDACNLHKKCVSYGEATKEDLNDAYNSCLEECQESWSKNALSCMEKITIKSPSDCGTLSMCIGSEY